VSVPSSKASGCEINDEGNFVVWKVGNWPNPSVGWGVVAPNQETVVNSTTLVCDVASFIYLLIYLFIMFLYVKAISNICLCCSDVLHSIAMECVSVSMTHLHTKLQH
jgi:hypothetical protein